MFTEKELEERCNFLGASEAAAILGFSRWQTPLEVWAYKTGQLVSDDSKNEMAKWWGNEFEESIAKRFCKETGKKVRRVTEAYPHPNYGFIRSHIDRKIEGERSILQCKMTTAFKAKEWKDEDEIPAEYIIQEVVEMACSGYETAYIAVAIGNLDFKIKVLTRDLKLEKDVISKLASFWQNFVEPKIMPENIKAGDDDVLNKLYPLALPQTEIALPDEVNIMMENLEAYNRDNKYLEAQISQIKNKLKALIKQNECGNTGIYKVFWKNIHKDPYEVKEQNYRMISYKKIMEEQTNGKTR